MASKMTRQGPDALPAKTSSIPPNLAALYPHPVRGANLYRLDRDLAALLERRASRTRFHFVLDDFSAFAGGPADEEAEYSDRFAPPRLVANVIRTNPKWRASKAEAFRLGAVGLNYGAAPAPFALTFAMGYLLSQSNVSLHCPVTMTGAVAYVLDRFAPAAVKQRYLNDLIRMDGKAVSAGTWVTEHHGGSDVGRTTTRAKLEGDHVLLRGLKWFTSAADGGMALATARPEGAPGGTAGLGLYLVPMRRPDRKPNALHLRRLKEKLGTRGLPTAEIDLAGAYALEVAPPPEGFRLMMEALSFSRIHNALSGAAVQRRALLEAMGYARGREAFGQTITHYPMVQDELLKILAPCEAGLALAMECAFAFDAADRKDNDAPERVWLRLVTALAKYMTAEDANAAARRALEIIGGNGYTEDYATARLVRDAQVLTVWEGPANIQALELLRLLDARFGAAELFAARIRGAINAGREKLGALAAALAAGLTDVEGALALLTEKPQSAPRHARKLLALMADVLAAALLLEAAAADAEAGDLRKALVLKLFLEDRLRLPDRRGILPDRGWTSILFEPLLAYAPINQLPAHCTV